MIVEDLSDPDATTNDLVVERLNRWLDKRHGTGAYDGLRACPRYACQNLTPIGQLHCDACKAKWEIPWGSSLDSVLIEP